MDPYLDQSWSTVHSSLNYLAAEVLQAQLGDDLVARSEDRVFVADMLGDVPTIRVINPHVHVTEMTAFDGPAGGAVAVLPEAGVAVEPLIFQIDSEPTRQHFIEIVDRSAGGRVVTVIEFVSPANKRPGDGYDSYRRKQNECRGAGVNLVEVDLTRSGKRELLVDRWPNARRYATTYAVSVWRAGTPMKCALYPIRVRDRLPTIKIPLRLADADVTLDLQAIVGRAYEAGRHDKTIDYAKPPDPPLEADDATWAAGIVAAAVA